MSTAVEMPRERRCRARPRPAAGLRPTDLVGAFFIAGIGMLAAAIVAGVLNAVDPWPWGRWLALHLAFVGGVSQLILGASQFFSGAFLATDPPSRGLIVRSSPLGTWARCYSRSPFRLAPIRSFGSRWRSCSVG